jgi:N-acetyl-anhydromuramyl-L-alanine amidase AmpD
MVGSWQGAAARFDHYGTKVSAHYGVKLDGGLIHWLEEANTAYHAGSYSMNQRSIGIEHEDGGDYNGVRPDSLYKTSANLVRDICTFYNIPIDRQHILKHSEVIPTGCPDALDIDRIVREAAALNAPPVKMATLPQSELDQLRKDRDTNYNNWQAEIQKFNALEQQFSDYRTTHPVITTVESNSSSVTTSTQGTTVTTPPTPPINTMNTVQTESPKTFLQKLWEYLTTYRNS